jgi:uncharacterized membrane protein
MFMMRLAFLTLLGLLTGGIVHLLSLLMVPALATQDAYGRVEAMFPANGFRPLSAAGDLALPFLDPAFSYRLCRYDLRDGPVRIRTSVNNFPVSLSFHARDSVVYFAVNEQSAVDNMLDILLYDGNLPPPERDDGLLSRATILVPAPTPTGIVMLRGLPAFAAQGNELAAVLNQAQCSAQGD